MDEAAKTLVVKDKKGEKTFDVSMAKNMPELKAGDKVSFNYIEKDGKLMAGNFQKAGAKAPAKTEAAPSAQPEHRHHLQENQLPHQHQQSSKQAPANKKGDLVSPFFIPQFLVYPSSYIAARFITLYNYAYDMLYARYTASQLLPHIFTGSASTLTPGKPPIAERKS